MLSFFAWSSVGASIWLIPCMDVSHRRVYDASDSLDSPDSPASPNSLDSPDSPDSPKWPDAHGTLYAAEVIGATDIPGALDVMHLIQLPYTTGCPVQKNTICQSVPTCYLHLFDTDSVLAFYHIVQVWVVTRKDCSLICWWTSKSRLAVRFSWKGTEGGLWWTWNVKQIHTMNGHKRM